MPVITLPDGKELNFDNPVSVAEVAQAIGPGLAKAAIAGVVAGNTVDTSFVIADNAELAIITDKDPAALEVIRHSCAHLMAQAVQTLFPKAQVTIGPVIEDGFYYDFAYEPGFTEADLTKIEAKMKELVKANLTVERHEYSRDETIKIFEAMGEHYKVEIIKDLPADEVLSCYRQGDFIDLCRGPHVPNTGKLKAFKLTKLAGAYWRGDSNNAMLQRIYGTAWANKNDLKDYLTRLEEAEKRDHRKLAKRLDLFHMQEEAPGMVFWHDKGWQIYIQIQDYIRAKLREHNYQEIRTPEVVDISLWQKSGHWDKYRDDMFSMQIDNREYAVKPMNCPCHVQVYNNDLKSYRDLPLRLAEFGSCHRNEASGALHGLMRLRNFVQDDAHIFCTPEQIQAEVSAFIDLVYEVYRDFGFNDVIVRLSTRPQKSIGSDEIWANAEQALEQALNSKGLDWELCPGDGAFYGPKIDFSLKDCIGRVWQCGTMQLDFLMPERLGASYIDESSQRATPVMLHRAILGSIERWLGILIEDFAGAMPPWLAAVQAVIMNITDNQAEYCQQMQQKLQQQGFRVDLDLRNEKIGFKIREHAMSRIPYLLVVGDKEVANQTLSVRTRSGEDLGAMTVADFSDKLNTEISMLAKRL